MIHYLGYLWSNLWPNMFAPSIFVLIGVGISHFRLKRHITQTHVAYYVTLIRHLHRHEREP